MCGPSSGWTKVATVVLLIGVAIHIAGWSTTNWMTYETTNAVIETDVGLWRQTSCSNGDCTDSSVDSDYETDAFNTVRAMETICFCMIIFCSILLFIYMCADMSRKQTMAMVIMILLFVAGACSFIGMIVFVTTIPSPFVVSWSLGLTVIAMTIILIAATLMIPDAFEPDPEDLDDNDMYSGRRRSLVSPDSISGRRHGQPMSRGITPVSYKGGFETSRWRSY